MDSASSDGDRPAARPVAYILETVRAHVPPEVFTTAYTNPVGGSPEAVRENLREALRLIKEAGYEVRDRKLVDVKTGAQLALELLNQDASFERVMLFYKPSLERLGIAVSVRTVDPTQYENRTARLGFRRRHQFMGASRCRRAMSSASSGRPRRPTSPARAILPASRIRRSTS